MRITIGIRRISAEAGLLGSPGLWSICKIRILKEGRGLTVFATFSYICIHVYVHVCVRIYIQVKFMYIATCVYVSVMSEGSFAAPTRIKLRPDFRTSSRKKHRNPILWKASPLKVDG